MTHAGPPFQSDPILMQFLLDEFLIACLIMRCIREMIELESLGQEIDRLVAEPKTRWSRRRGPLHNLRRYAEGFAPSCLNLRVAASKAYHTALQAQEIINQYGYDTASLPELVDRLLRHFGAFADEIPELIQRFQDDENVLYYLLQHRIEFDEVYEPSFIKGICEENGEKIVERYRARGFEHIIPDIESRIAELESVAV